MPVNTGTYTEQISRHSVRAAFLIEMVVNGEMMSELGQKRKEILLPIKGGGVN